MNPTAKPSLVRLRTAAGLAADHAVDTLLVVGAASMSYGAWLVYAPAGYITGGLLLILGGLLAARRAG